jgi:hypothetical protein
MGQEGCSMQIIVWTMSTRRLKLLPSLVGCICLWTLRWYARYRMYAV